ncbi:MAG: NAD(P)/FAD-dependent oxidoreductase [Gammaproteobacteria bacterium]|nr:NAD(P)/FAD-dependent oxidoreductase [Gammaproteobacteria bacterium]
MSSEEEQVDVVIIGAGASGLMCAAAAGQRGRSVLLLDHARKAGNKIRLSGGGRCNFTNYDLSADNYLSHNPHFVKSALSRYSQWHFIELVSRYRIPYHEREHGQLFCDESAKGLLEMLLAECREAGVTLRLKSAIERIERGREGGFRLATAQGGIACTSLVVATGGLSYPTMGATPFGYKIAEQFGIKVWPPSAGLVPFTLQPADKARLAPLAGIAVEATVSCGDHAFRENVLFTHRGLSGPAILQISNYWSAGETLTIDWLPGRAVAAELEGEKLVHPRQQLKRVVGRWLPQRLVAALLPPVLGELPMNQLGRAQLAEVEQLLRWWQLKPSGTEGYRTAEVTTGGVDCDALSSKTMEAKAVPGLYFIGEVVDVTGWLGGYNLQWAWSSGWCAGQVV